MMDTCRACGRPIDDHLESELSNCADNLALGQQSTTKSTEWRPGVHALGIDTPPTMRPLGLYLFGDDAAPRMLARFEKVRPHTCLFCKHYRDAVLFGWCRLDSGDSEYADDKAWHSRDYSCPRWEGHG